MQTIDTQASQLIDDFAKKLLALNNGKKIPTSWTKRLKEELKKTSPNKTGVKPDYKKIREAVKLLTLNDEAITSERTKQHSPATVKNRIANEVGITRKTLDRIEVDRISKNEQCARLDSLDPETRKAHIEGMSDAMIHDLLNDKTD